MQFTPAIAANSNQRDVAHLSETVVDPETLQKLVDKFGARFNELLGRNACVKCASQPAMENLHVGFDMRAGQFMRWPDARVIGLVGEGGKGCISILFG